MEGSTFISPKRLWSLPREKGENCPLMEIRTSTNDAGRNLFTASARHHPPLSVRGIYMEPLNVDPFAEVKSNSFLRLSNDCPERGVLIQFLSFPPKVIKNLTFGEKEEYHWEVALIEKDGGYQKTMVETSSAFRAALKTACGKDLNPTQRFFLIRWKHEAISKGRTAKAWIIKELNGNEANAHVSVAV